MRARPSSPEPLPAAWVDRIFARLTVRYGHSFMSRWAGTDMGLVKSDWAVELAGLQDRPDALAHGLAHLPESEPPTVGRFRTLCLGCPPRPMLALPSPQPDPMRVAVIVSGLREPASSDGHAGPRAWALRLRDRELGGEKLGRHRSSLWREALGMPLRPSSPDES